MCLPDINDGKSHNNLVEASCRPADAASDAQLFDKRALGSVRATDLIQRNSLPRYCSLQTPVHNTQHTALHFALGSQE